MECEGRRRELPIDYVADVLRVDLAHMGCSRIVLLGSEEDMGGELKTCLARWRLQVMTPPKQERAWIAELVLGRKSCDQRVDAHDGRMERLRTLLADGVEHGAQAIVVTNEETAGIVRACGPGVPTLSATTRGSHVRVRHVVFDMGGVLFRWDPLAMARRVCADEEDARLLARAVFGSTEWAWQDAGAVDEQTVIWTSKTRVPHRLFSSVEKLVLHWHDHRVAIPGMSELIHDLKDAGFGVYLLSNAGESFARYEGQLPARECFDGMVVSYREHVVKPDARIYEALLKRYELDAGECLFIDDTQANVLGARRVGMRALRFCEDVHTLRAILLG